MHGKGKFYWPDGKKFEGEFKEDKKDGYGEIQYTDGRIYRGFWSRNKENGKGEIFDPVQNAWRKGEWLKGKLVKWLEDENTTL